jgi:uncharacterized protein (TIGR02001 family)
MRPQVGALCCVSVVGVGSMSVSRSLAALCGSTTVALCALSGTALAEDKLSWSASLTGTSDYVFRGISQTKEDPTIQGSLGLAYDIFYAGAWASGLDWGPGSDAQLEVDWYAGIKPVWKTSPVGPVSFDFGVIYYTYPGFSDPPGQEADYVELKAAYTLPSPFIKNLTTGGTFYWSPDYSGETGSVWTSESTASYALPKVWVFDPTVSGLLGYEKGNSSDGFNPGGKDHYYYWNAGLTLAVENLSFDFRYWDTDLDPGGLCGTASFQCDERFVFSATLTLP